MAGRPGTQVVDYAAMERGNAPAGRAQLEQLPLDPAAASPEAPAPVAAPAVPGPADKDALPQMRISSLNDKQKDCLMDVYVDHEGHVKSRGKTISEKNKLMRT